jgi:hypothetical protein
VPSAEKQRRQHAISIDSRAWRMGSETTTPEVVNGNSLRQHTHTLARDTLALLNEPLLGWSEKRAFHTSGSDSLQVLDQIFLARIAEVQLEVRIVVVHHVEQGGEASVVVEAALLMRPESS